MHIYVFIMGKKVVVAQNSAGSSQHNNQRIYYPCGFYGRGFWTTAGAIADDNSVTAMVSDIWMNDSLQEVYFKGIILSKG